MTETARGETATIINSGSTNVAGFQIEVHSSGLIEGDRAALAGRPGRVAVMDPALAGRLFEDLRAACPFSQYADKGCVKSASFGFSLRIEFMGEHSPDLACPLTDDRLTALARDVRAIEDAVRAYAGRPYRPGRHSIDADIAPGS